MFARCVQNTKTAMNTLITNSGDRTPTVSQQQHRQQRRAGQRSERDVAARPEHDTDEHEQHETASGSGASARKTPAAVATPFPPFRSPRKTGRTCPAIAATPHSDRPQIADRAGHDDRARRSEERDDGERALQHVEQRTRAMPIFARRARETRSSRRDSPSRACEGRPRAACRRCTRPGSIRTGMTSTRATAGSCDPDRFRRLFRRISDAQRIAGESPRIAKAVVEIADVVLLDEIGMVAEDGDRRRRTSRPASRSSASPRDRPPAAAGGARAARRASRSPATSRCACDAPRSTSSSRSRTCVTRWPVSADVKRNGTNLRKGAFSPRGLLELGRRLVVLLGEIPLVDDDDQPAPALPRERSRS